MSVIDNLGRLRSTSGCSANDDDDVDDDEHDDSDKNIYK
jgi:hypothetical protein